LGIAAQVLLAVVIIRYVMPFFWSAIGRHGPRRRRLQPAGAGGQLLDGILQ
jgi:hypothetical protein